MAAVDPANIKWYLSGGASNDSAAASLGGARSTSTKVTEDALFDDVSGAEATAGHTDYRCIYVVNEDADTLSDCFVWISSNTASEDTAITIGLDLAGKNGTADTIATETTAPDPAVTFSAAASKGAGLDVGDLEQNDYYAIWIKRVVGSSAAAVTGDTFTIKIEGDSAA